jgi:hypothetical protein
MTRKEPKQPIPLYPTATVTPGPEPIQFPKPALTDEQLRNYVATLVARTMHRSVNRLMEPDIVVMSEQEFVDFCKSVLREDA